MRLALSIIGAGTLAFVLVLVFAPESPGDDPDLQNDTRRERGGARDVLGHDVRTTGVYTPRQGVTRIDGQRVTFPELLVWSGRSQPEGEDGHLFEDLRILWNPAPRSEAERGRVVDVPITTPRGEIATTLSEAIGRRASGITAGRARIIGDRLLQAVRSMSIERGIELFLVDPADPMVDRIAMRGERLELDFVDGIVRTASSNEAVVLETPFGRLEAAGMTVDIEAGSMRLKGPVTGSLEPSSGLSGLLPRVDEQEDVTWLCEGGLTYLPDDVARDRATRKPAGLIKLDGRVNFRQGARSFEGRDLEIRVGREGTRIQSFATTEPFRTEDRTLLLTGTSLTYGPEEGEDLPPDTWVLKTGGGLSMLTLREEQADGRMVAATTIEAREFISWSGIGGFGSKVWKVEAAGNVKLDGPGRSANGSFAYLLVDERTELPPEERYPRTLQVKGYEGVEGRPRIPAEVRYTDVTLSGWEITSTEGQGTATTFGEDRIVASGSPTLLWKGAVIPAGRNARVLAEHLGTEGSLRLVASESIGIARDRNRPGRVSIEASSGVRIERLAPDGGLPLATLSCGTLSLDLERGRQVDALDAPTPGWEVRQVVLAESVEATLGEDGTFRAGRVELDLVTGILQMSGPGETSFEWRPLDRRAVADAMTLDLDLGQAELVGNVEVGGALPVLAIGRFLKDATNDDTPLPAKLPATLRADRIVVRTGAGRSGGSEITALHARSAGELRFDQPGVLALTGSELTIDVASGWSAAQGSPLSIVHAHPQGFEDRLEARGVAVRGERSWWEGRVEATLHVRRGALPVDIPGWRRETTTATRIVPARLSARDGLYWTSERMLGEGNVVLSLRDDARDELVEIRGESLAMSLTDRAPLEDPTLTRGSLRLDRAVVVGRAAFRTPEFEGSGERLLLAADRRQLLLITPGGKATLTTPDTGPLEKARFEIDFSDPRNPKLTVSDVPGGG